MLTCFVPRLCFRIIMKTRKYCILFVVAFQLRCRNDLFRNAYMFLKCLHVLGCPEACHNSPSTHSTNRSPLRHRIRTQRAQNTAQHGKFLDTRRANSSTTQMAPKCLHETRLRDFSVPYACCLLCLLAVLACRACLLCLLACLLA